MKHQTGFVFLTSRWWPSLREHCSDLPPHTADAWTQPAGASFGPTQLSLERRETLPGGAKDHRRILSGSNWPLIHVAVATSGVLPYNSPNESFFFFFLVLQVITFRDYLLHIVGPDFIARQLSTYPGYSETVDPSISNVFATAAYRFAHLMVQPFVFRLDENYREHPQYPSVLLHTAFFAPWRVIYEGTAPDR